MTVRQLIQKLQTMPPPDVQVGTVFDGAVRLVPDRVYVSRRGSVVLGEAGGSVYYTEDRPPSAPRAVDEPYWTIP